MYDDDEDRGWKVEQKRKSVGVVSRSCHEIKNLRSVISCIRGGVVNNEEVGVWNSQSGNGQISGLLPYDFLSFEG